MLRPDELRAAAEEIGPGIVADRRAIHQQPELGYQETKTSALVAARLRALGLEVRAGVGKTGVIGVLRGGRPGKTVLLRADMDALPITEENQTDYVSQTPGVMHACGHDAHTAMLMGVARVLADKRDQIPGAVKFMFQPAEEGGAGALAMIEDGLLEDPPVDAAFALHVDTDRYVGQVAVRSGPSQAAADRFDIIIRGKGGHAARPHGSVDPIVVGAQLVTALQTLVSREVKPIEPAVITVGSFVAGTTYNVIPDTAKLLGTVRTFDAGVRRQLKARIIELAHGLAASMRATAEVIYSDGYPIVVNDAAMADVVAGAARDVLGKDAVSGRDPVMGAEDFAYICEKVPGVLYYLGVRNRAWPSARPVHTATFDLDEEALPLGVATMAATALRFLES